MIDRLRHPGPGGVYLKRAYEPPTSEDGQRFLVERLWPRGVRKAGLRLDGWLKEVAPSPALRQWFSHDPAKWPTFKRRYINELRANEEALLPLRDAICRGPITLVYGARDTEHNAAVALREYLTLPVPPQSSNSAGRRAGSRSAPAPRSAPRQARQSPQTPRAVA